MSLDNSYLRAIQSGAKPCNGSSILPFIQYKNHVKALDQVRAPTDTGLNSPEKAALFKTKKIRHELTAMFEKKHK